MPLDARAVLARPVIVAEVEIRPCRAEDLPQLEWYGIFRDHRELFDRAFARHMLGENVMLVADLGLFPVGQAWVDLTKNRGDRSAYIWAVRVFPFLRGLGIGTRLLEASEAIALGHDCRWAEVGVEKDNPDARRLYERLGYTYARELTEQYQLHTPDGAPVTYTVDQWLLRKSLG
jgi:ribosomal protein S18 acetylase RimI-like enzyme